MVQNKKYDSFVGKCQLDKTSRVTPPAKSDLCFLEFTNTCICSVVAAVLSSICLDSAVPLTSIRLGSAVSFRSYQIAWKYDEIAPPARIRSHPSKEKTTETLKKNLLQQCKAPFFSCFKGGISSCHPHPFWKPALIEHRFRYVHAEHISRVGVRSSEANTRRASSVVTQNLYLIV